MMSPLPPVPCTMACGPVGADDIGVAKLVGGSGTGVDVSGTVVGGAAVAWGVSTDAS